MSSKEKSVKRNIPSIGLAIAVGTCIFYYLLIYIPANEKMVKLRGVRQLNRFGQNCVALYDERDEGVKAAKGQSAFLDKTLQPTKMTDAVNGINYDGSIASILLTWRSANKTNAFQMNVDDFVHPLEDFNEFEDIILVDTDTSNYGRVLDKSKLDLAFYPIKDSLLNHGVTIEKVDLSSQTYYAFHKRINLGKSELAAIGLISKTSFDARARLIPPFVIIFFLLGFLLLLLAWPILKLLLVNEHERLTGGDIQLTNYAVILGSAFFAITVAGCYMFLVSAPSGTDETLKDLSNLMSKNFKREIWERKEVLKLNDIFPTFEDYGQRLEKFRYNEIFSVEPITGSVKKLVTEPELHYYEAYKNFKRGDVDVKTRPYYTEMVKPVDLSMLDAYFLQSIRSRTSGVQECAVSIPFSPAHAEDEIRVITSTLRSVIDPVLPSNFGFVVFDREGVVQFHSISRKVLNENFLEECANNSELKSLINNNANGFIDINYNEHDCRAYFQPLASEWYILTYYNTLHTGNMASSVMSFSLVSFSSILLYIFLLHLLFKLDQPKFRVLRSKPFFYQWLNPTAIPREKLIFLSRVLGGVLVFDIIWFFTGASIVGTFYWVILTITMCYSLVYRLLRPRARNAYSASTRFEKWCYGLIGLWTLLFIINGWITGSITSIILVVAIGAIYVVLYRRASVFDLNRGEIITSKGNYRLYRLFLLFGLLVMAVAPALNFFKDHFVHERIIRTRKTAIDEINKLSPPSLSQAVDIQKDQNKSGPYLNYDALLGNYKADEKEPDSTHDDYFHLSDSWFYDQTINYFGQDEVDHSGLVVPNDSIAWDLKHDSKRVYLRLRDAPGPKLQNTYTQNDRWSSLAMISFPLEISASPVIPAFVIIGLLLFWAFWAITFEITRRVFYLPLYHHSSWRPSLVKIPPSNEGAMGTVHAFSAKIGTNLPIKGGDSIIAFRQLAPKFEAENELTHVEVKLLGGGYTRLTAEFEMNTLTTRKVFNDYFNEAWKGLSDVEKYFLYDLAEDGIVNQYDKKMMDKMTEMGFIRLLPLEISHPAIGEFIIEAMNRKYLAKMDKKARAEGRWSNFRIPLAIVIIATLGFLSIVQEGLFAKVSALLASVTVVIPTLLNLVSQLPKLLPGRRPVATPTPEE